MELKKLLYAVDLEDAPHPAIEHVKMVASLTGASVSIVYVLPSETVYESNYLSGEGQPNRIAPTQALLEKMEHFLNTNFPEGRRRLCVPHGEDFGRSRQIRPQERHRLHRRRRAWPDRVPATVRRVRGHGSREKGPLLRIRHPPQILTERRPALSRQARKSITRFGTSRLAGGFFMRKSVPRIRPAALARMG